MMMINGKVTSMFGIAKKTSVVQSLIKVCNSWQLEKYDFEKKRLSFKNNGNINEKLLFHGTIGTLPFTCKLEYSLSLKHFSFTGGKPWLSFTLAPPCICIATCYFTPRYVIMIISTYTECVSVTSIIKIYILM